MLVPDTGIRVDILKKLRDILEKEVVKKTVYDELV